MDSEIICKTWSLCDNNLALFIPSAVFSATYSSGSFSGSMLNNIGSTGTWTLVPEIFGCMNQLSCNYDSTATFDDGSCDLPSGCYDSLYLEYDPSVTCSDANACITLIVSGCLDSTALNYNPLAHISDSSCIINCEDEINISFTTLNNMGNGTSGYGATVFTGNPYFTYYSVPSSGNHVSILFGNGQMENNYDEIYIYDENGTILNSPPYYDVSGQLFSANGSINIEFDTDGSVTRTLNWSVY